MMEQTMGYYLEVLMVICLESNLVSMMVLRLASMMVTHWAVKMEY